MKHQKPPSLYSALNGAANGYSVVPVDGRTGEPLLDIERASTDPEVIRGWWDRVSQRSTSLYPAEAKGIEGNAICLA